MAMSPETKEKLKKALPWVIGGAVVLFVLVKLAGGKKRGGPAPVQDLSALGGGNGSTLVQQPQPVPADIAQQFATAFGSSRERRAAMAANWQQQQPNQAGVYTGVVSKAWKQLTSGGWEDIFHPGHTITEQQAQSLSGKNKGPYAKGGGGFFGSIGQALRGIIGGPVTLGNTLGFAGQVYGASAGYAVPRQVPSASGAPRRQPGSTQMISTGYQESY